MGDYFTNYTAKDVCSECGKCSGNQTEVFSPSPTVVPNNSTNLCIGNRTNFTTSYGNCTDYGSISSYWKLFDNGFWKWMPIAFCSSDMDNSTNYTANDVCSECGKCSDPQTEGPSTTEVPTPSPTVVLNNSTNLCIGNRNNFTTPWGDCSIYYDFNLTYCSQDTDNSTNYTAKDVCSECGKCSDPQTKVPTTSPTVVPNNSTNLCIGNRNNFTTPYGNCTDYGSIPSNWKFFDDDNGGASWMPIAFCSSDMDNSTNYTANDVCSECGKCSDPQTEGP